jgi:hypothetical protein
MRTTLTLDDDVLELAQAHARREKVSIGAAISRLVRAGLRAETQTNATMAPPRHRFALLPARDEIITVDHVRRLMDQEGI